MEQSNLNFFQLAAIQLKIRLNAGISFPVTSPGTIASLWYRTIATHGAHLQIGLARLSSEPSKARPIIVRQPLKTTAGASTKLNFAPPVIVPFQGKCLDQLVAENLYPNQDLPVTGPALLYIFTNEQEQAAAMVVNVCAALWDATTIRNILNTFMKLLESQTSVISNPPSTKDLYTQLGGWERYVQERADQSTPDPLFLPMGEDNEHIVGIAEILCGSPASSEKDRRVSVVLELETVTGCQKVVDHCDLSLSSLIGASFLYALVEIYFRTYPEKSIITLVQSTQIDPRTMLGDNERNYVHAVGVLYHATTVTRDGMECQSVVEWLIEEVKRSDRNKQTRLDRGEGLHRTLEVATGQIDPAQRAVPCLEFVYHGMYETPTKDYEVSLGHRLDICPHTSIVMHRERASGLMKIEAQIGKEQGHEATLQWLDRCKELWKEVATTSL